MISYVLKRFFLMLGVFFVIVSLIYMITTTAQLAIWSFPHPIIDDVKYAFELYKVYLHQVFIDGYLGETTFGLDIKAMAIERIPITMKISVAALLFYLPIGVFLGIVCTYFKGSIIDKLISSVSLALGSIPSFILMFFFILFFGYKLNWFPAIYDPHPDDPISLIMNLAMPVMALSLLPIANTIRVVKGELSEEMESKYVLLLRTKGLTKWQALTRHALKNSLIPVVQDVTITFGLILTMGFLIEMTYNVHGIAYLFYQGMIVPSLDYNYFFIDVPLATMTSAFYAGFILIISFIADISVAFLDPRIKIHGKKV